MSVIFYNTSNMVYKKHLATSWKFGKNKKQPYIFLEKIRNNFDGYFSKLAKFSIFLYINPQKSKILPIIRNNHQNWGHF